MPLRRPAFALLLLPLSTGCAEGANAPTPVAECAPSPLLLQLSPAFPAVAVGDTVRVRALAFVGCPAVPAAFAWSSADPRVASVDSAGLVTGRQPGTTTLRAQMLPARGPAQDMVVTVRGR